MEAQFGAAAEKLRENPNFQFRFIFALKNEIKQSEEKIKTVKEKLTTQPMMFKAQKEIGL